MYLHFHLHTVGSETVDFFFKLKLVNFGASKRWVFIKLTLQLYKCWLENKVNVTSPNFMGDGYIFNWTEQCKLKQFCGGFSLIMVD